MRKKYGYAFIFLIIGTYILSILARILVIYVIETLPNSQAPDQESLFEIITEWKYLIQRYIPSLFSVSFVFLFIKFFLDYDRTLNKSLQLNKEKIEAELKILKTQLNPHFLFNTLNNIYTLSLENSPKTPVSIGKLSEILDHVLYRCNEKFVSLSSEIELLKNYIELEKLRYDERLQVSFISNMERDTKIPPLILLSLVENAFKHGAGEDSGSPKIDIEVFNKKGDFIFIISNTVSKDYISIRKENIGLTNIRKQLDLVYENNYSLTIHNSENMFAVTLKINQK
ncbi:sensor histidine kinase [Aquimarina sp. AU474]|uniref:sensor histidine kinase n=1 Tax=Aquimarina sp. AU474 TaxID=2108529 RepID=UPI001F1C7B88|nr:histidine kinase [Aquimarina sp. AU474]